MQTTFELARFRDGRLMLRVRFHDNSNFWIQESDEATWVPTFSEVLDLKEFLDVIDEYNSRYGDYGTILD